MLRDNKIPFDAALDDLNDVDIQNPQDGDTIVWDSTSQDWVNASVTGTSGTSGSSGSSGSSGTSGVDGTSGSSGTSGVDGTSGAYTFDEKNNIELHTAYKAAVEHNDKELIYDVTNKLEEVKIYDSDTTGLLFIKVLSYDINDNLETVVLTRQSDSATLTKNFSYDVNGNLISVTET